MLFGSWECCCRCTLTISLMCIWAPCPHMSVPDTASPAASQRVQWGRAVSSCRCTLLFHVSVCVFRPELVIVIVHNCIVYGRCTFLPRRACLLNLVRLHGGPCGCEHTAGDVLAQSESQLSTMPAGFWLETTRWAVRPRRHIWQALCVLRRQTTGRGYTNCSLDFVQ